MAAPDGSKVVLREARPDDLPALVRLLGQLSLDLPREDPGPPLPADYDRAFREIGSDPRQTLLVACVNGRVVGSCTVVVVPNLSFRGRPFTLVDSVVVEEAMRGRGIGRLMMERARTIAREAGSYKVSLTSNARRADAHLFYERLGFKATHRGFTIEP